MKPHTHLLVGLVLCIGVGNAAAQGGQPLREAESENKRFHLRIRPGRPGSGAVRGCKATLFERSKERHRARPRWERFLVNDVAPVVALVRNDGHIVITLDEHRVGGARHTVAIYGQRGELLRHFLLPDLLRAEDWKQIKVRKESIDWLGGAKYRFTEDPPQFVITLKHGREIRIDLRTLQVVPDAAGAGVAAANVIPVEFLALLFGEEAARSVREASELAELTPEERAQAQEPAEGIAAGAEGEEAGAAERLAQGEATEETGAPPEGVEAQQRHEARPDGAVAAEAAAAGDVDQGAVPEEVARAERLSAAGGIVVPLPDPAEPFDYLAWANEAVLTDGPNAAPEYQAAMDNLAPWEGDHELFRAAISGDAEALASPEVQAWLDANRQAMDHFRRATDLEFAGWELNSADGSLLGAVLPHLSSLRQLAYATVLDGRLLEAEGNRSTAAGNYIDAFAAGTHTGSGVTIIENLVGVAIQKLAADALIDLQAADTGGEIDYPDLAQRLESSCRPTRPLGESMQFERAMFMDCLQRLYDYDPGSGSYLLNVAQADDYLSQGRNADPAARQEQLWHLMDTGYEQTRKAGDAFYDGMTEAMSLPFPQAQQRMREIEQSVADNPDANPLVRLLAPSLRRAHVLHVRAESYGRATRVIATLRAFRQQHGVYPESLQAFGGADFAIDPLTARPFRYRVDGDDFTLYSLGSNQTDEGGAHDPKARTNDIRFWPRPNE